MSSSYPDIIVVRLETVDSRTAKEVTDSANAASRVEIWPNDEL